MGTFTAAAVIPAYEEIAEDVGVSLQRTSYLTSLQIAILGGAPLFWKPLSQRYGRRPIFLLSLILSCVCNIGCAKSPDYASMAACRALVAFFISPAMAIGSAVVTETFFKRERAQYMGIWAVMVTLGVPVGPLIFGFVAQRVGYQWIYWTLAIVSTDVATCGGFATNNGLSRPTPSNSSSTYSSVPKHDTSEPTCTPPRPSSTNTSPSDVSTLLPSNSPSSTIPSPSSPTFPSSSPRPPTPWSSSSRPS